MDILSQLVQPVVVFFSVVGGVVAAAYGFLLLSNKGRRFRHRCLRAKRRARR